MEVLYGSSIFCTVEKVHGDMIIAKSNLVSTDYEAEARIRAGLTTFIIQSAGWNIFRSPGGTLNGGREEVGLKGIEAYFQAGRDLKQVLGDEGGGWPRELMSECVRGIIQSETFIQVERGYLTPQSYDDYWKDFYKGSCRYFSNLDRISIEWGEYVNGQDYAGGNVRQRGLYSKNSSCTVCRRGDGGFTAIGSFIDSFHEIGIVISMTADGIVTDCTGNLLRAPDRVCTENQRHLELLLGKKIAGLSKKDVAAVAGGPQGCIHLVDIIYDLGRAAEFAMQRCRQD